MLNRKITLAIGLDLFFGIVSFWLSIQFYEEKSNLIWNDETTIFSIVCSLIGILILAKYGIYKTIYQYVGIKFFVLIFWCILWYFFIILFINWFVNINQHISIILIHTILFLLFIITSRVIANTLSLNIKYRESESNGFKNVLIYGAGVAGNQLAISIFEGYVYRLKGFIDDNHNIKGKNINTFPVYHSSEIEKIIKKYSIDEIFLALPSVSSERYHEILNFLSNFNIKLRTLPKLSELPQRKARFKDIRNVNIEDLLLRFSVQPNIDLLKKNITSKIVLVTGAAGSVGSELCRQIIRMRPHKLLILDNNEYQLYKINDELSVEAIKYGVSVCSLLSSVSDKNSINKIIKKWKPHTLYHAAAYKHVSIVEKNLSFGVKNNVFGTLFTAQAALEYKVKNFVLISTDKAVRPTSAMGASKRIAEIIVQSLSSAQKNWSGETCFSIVRFGNVLGSSGSVVPLFEKQIKMGGPITLSHPDVTRYFMTIPEAAQLVIQAGAMADGGDVFLLDMGEPVKIKKLAENMIKLAGLSIKNNENPDGDIEIVISGLKPGEKLYEEMLIDAAREVTDHQKILKAKENYITWNTLNKLLDKLDFAIENLSAKQIILILKLIVPEYSPDKIISDHLSSQYEN